MNIELLDYVDHANLLPVDSRRINSADSRDTETQRIVRESSLSLRAEDLIDMTAEDIALLSKRIRLLFTRIASQNKLRIGSGDLELFKDADENALVHELSHLHEYKRLRPEIIPDAFINILPLVQNGQLRLAMNVWTPVPEVEYTVMEKANIHLAPHKPSPADFHSLIHFMMEHRAGITDETIGSITDIVKGKRQTQTENDFLARLSAFNNS
jgi:hypothetical protein